MTLEWLRGRRVREIGAAVTVVRCGSAKLVE